MYLTIYQYFKWSMTSSVGWYVCSKMLQLLNSQYTKNFYINCIHSKTVKLNEFIQCQIFMYTIFYLCRNHQRKITIAIKKKKRKARSEYNIVTWHCMCTCYINYIKNNNIHNRKLYHNTNTSPQHLVDNSYLPLTHYFSDVFRRFLGHSPTFVA